MTAGSPRARSTPAEPPQAEPSADPARAESPRQDPDRLDPAAAPAGTAVRVRVRYFAGARAAAGVTEETVRIASEGFPGAGVDAVLDAILALHGAALARVLPACSFLLDGVAVRDRSTEVTEGAQFDVLPPFAGG